MSEQVQAIELLQSRVRTLELYLREFLYKFNQEVEATLKQSKRSKKKPSIELASWKAMQKYKENLRDELRGAIFLGSEHGVELVVCRKLAIALDSGADPIPFVFDTDVELERLIEKLLFIRPRPGDEADDELERAIKLWNDNPEMTKKELELAIEEGNYNHLSFFNSVKAYSDKRYGEGHLRKGKRGSPRIKRE